MVWTWKSKLISKAVSKVGVKGKIAALYIMSGHSVSFNVKVKDGIIDFVAKKKGDVLAVDVYLKNKPVSAKEVENIARKAFQINAKPVLLIYGSAKISEEALSRSKELNVKIKRVREVEPRPH
ncbi:MAG: hypothetical protein B6U76_03055 [Desulfurococcales archaeon ex4484_217_2]|nr:MAG: hypothetical protein B6U76_03055 [Desulfurococcales archaeon ex4484_217_2]